MRYESKIMNVNLSPNQQNNNNVRKDRFKHTSGRRSRKIQHGGKHVKILKADKVFAFLFTILKVESYM